jgi:hypothetical protein
MFGEACSEYLRLTHDRRDDPAEGSRQGGWRSEELLRIHVADLAWFQLMNRRAIPIPARMSSPNGPPDMDNR